MAIERDVHRIPATRHRPHLTAVPRPLETRGSARGRRRRLQGLATAASSLFLAVTGMCLLSGSPAEEALARGGGITFAVALACFTAWLLADTLKDLLLGDENQPPTRRERNRRSRR